VVWAYKDGKFGFKKVTPGGPEEVVQIVLDRREGEVFAADLWILSHLQRVRLRLMFHKRRERRTTDELPGVTH